MTIGQTIKLYRKEKNFTQSELAELIGVSTQAISKWETDSGMPDISQIVPLARVLEISTDKLLGHTYSAFEREVTEIRQKFGGINFISDLNYAEELYILTSKFFNKHPDVSDIAVVALETHIELFVKGKTSISKSEFLEECERYGNSIFRYETVADRIYKTHYLMARAYNLCDDNKKAKSYLQNLPYVFGFRDYWEAEIALEKAKKSFAQIARFTSRCIRLAGRVVRAEGGSDADKISLELDEYPSIPIFLKYCPELVNAMCRPIFEFASMPVWNADFAPHDIGRYPYATGQMYAFKKLPLPGEIMPNVYEFSADADCYDYHFQMPIEECGNMLIMIETAMTFNASIQLAEKYMPLLEKWANYLLQYGEDPENQLCTDDFAGHLAHNANLAAKAVVGIACYSRILSRFNKSKEAEGWNEKAHKMAATWLNNANINGQEGTSLTLKGDGWSLKYNWVWDCILHLDLLPKEFYINETESYLKHQNRYGIPLDSRADYTKSDWLCWVAAMGNDNFRKVCFRALADFLQTTSDRVPFSDWYDTITGDYMFFIARSVQGGLFMPMLLNNVAKN